MTEHEFRLPWTVEKGDIFSAPGNMIIRVTRRSRSDDWVDVLVVTDGGVWTKRMPQGIPSAWPRLPRR